MSKLRPFLALCSILFLLILISSQNQPVLAQQNATAPLSAHWPPIITQWSDFISITAQEHGLDPDFVAAVVFEESNGVSDGISIAGAVGLMGVMPRGPGLEWRPEPEELLDPATNLRWGVAIIAEIIRQSGGDLHSALAAYAGGWSEVNSRIPQEYASHVLDNYARALVVRHDISPDVASQWTIAIEIQQGNVLDNSIIVLGEQPISGLRLFAQHTVYHDISEAGYAYHVTGYAVPIALVSSLEETEFGQADELNEILQTRLKEPKAVKSEGVNPRILLACLPSLSRLRGHVSTRWFAPSSCPNWHR